MITVSYDTIIVSYALKYDKVMIIQQLSLLLYKILLNNISSDNLNMV